MQRVMIVGSAGSGKSTLARKLASITGLPLFHTDKVYWEPGWRQRPVEEAKAMIEQIAARPTWIIEGNNSSTFPVRAKRADTIIWLDMPTRICLYRVIKRLVENYGATREDMAENCPETINLEYLKFLQWVRNYKNTSRPGAVKLLSDARSSILKYHLSSNIEVAEFVENLNAGVHAIQ